MNIISNIALITINETLFVQLLSFLIFLFIINRIMLRPIKSTMTERDDYMAKMRNDVVNAAAELESLTKKLQAKERKTKKEAFGVQNDLEELGNQESDKILKSTLEEIELIKDEYKARIDAQVLEARKYLQQEAQVHSFH